MARKKLKPKNGAPYVETDIHELGDKRLSPDEAVIREREDLIKVVSAKKIAGQEGLEDSERAGGARMAWTEVIRRLQKINSEIQARDGISGHIALYRPKRRDEYQPMDWEQVPPGGPFFRDHVYVYGMEKQPTPEWSVVTLDNAGLPERERIGWRSVVLAFIKSGAIPYRNACEEFGDPSSDLRAYREGGWFDQVKKFMEAR